MRNCITWTWRGSPYEVCDFGTSLLAHLPSGVHGETNTIRVDRDTTWSLGELGRAWSDKAVLTIRDEEGCAISLLVTSSVGRVLERWLTRTATREDARNSDGS